MLLLFLRVFLFKVVTVINKPHSESNEIVTVINNPNSEGNEDLSSNDYRYVILSIYFDEYIEYMVYAALTTIHGHSLNFSYNNRQSLLGFTNAIPAAIAHGYPCQQTKYKNSNILLTE